MVVLSCLSSAFWNGAKFVVVGLFDNTGRPRMGLQKLGPCSSFPKDFDCKIMTIVNCFMPIKVLNMVESNLDSNTTGARIIPILHSRKLEGQRDVLCQRLHSCYKIYLAIVVSAFNH